MHEGLRGMIGVALPFSFSSLSLFLSLSLSLSLSLYIYIYMYVIIYLYLTLSLSLSLSLSPLVGTKLTFLNNGSKGIDMFLKKLQNQTHQSIKHSESQLSIKLLDLSK